MKTLILVTALVSSISIPAFAAEICREQAQQMGYVGALEVLRSCNESTVEPQLETRKDPQAKNSENATSSVLANLQDN